MKIELTLLRGKVARRIFSRFVVSALIPIVLLAFLSFDQVNTLLVKQQHEQLRQASKQYGMALLGRLSLLNLQLEWVADHFRRQESSADRHAHDSTHAGGHQGFQRIVWIEDQEPAPSSLPDGGRLVRYLQTEMDYLSKNGGILISDPRADAESAVYLLRLVDPRQPDRGALVGEIDLAYLWGDTDIFGEGMQVCVLNESNQFLFCSSQPFQLTADQLREMDKSATGRLTWRGSNYDLYLANYWALFLQPRFLIPKWTVVASQAKTDTVDSLVNFRTIFAFVIALTLASVALLSIHQIRRNMVPLENLMEGVKRIANQDFTTPVNVTSGDEFEELAHAVNRMALRMDRQFQTLSTLAAIDRLILSTLKIEDIIEIVLSRMSEIVAHDAISLVIFNLDSAGSCRVYTWNAALDDPMAFEVETVSALEYQHLLENLDCLAIAEPNAMPGYLESLRRQGVRTSLLLPLLLKEEVTALIALGYRAELALTAEDIRLARDFGNRVAVALSNASWEEQLFHMAHYDALTGLPNRMLMQDRLQQALARAKRKDTFIAVLFVDLDRFKQVNDSLGHLAGDSLLRQVAQRLKSDLRNEDTIARLGGDEFVVIIAPAEDGRESLPIATKVAKKIMDDLALPFAVGDRQIYTSASVGIACYPDDGQTVNELLKNADSAMYHAKASGKNNYQFYSKVLNDEALERLDLENHLRQALSRDEFELYYQPKIDVRTQAICGAEALLRWNHPRLGRVSPARFIPICEEIGLIHSIEEWVIQSACRQVKEWTEHGFPLLRIAVNLSPLQFRQANLVKQVTDILAAAGVSTRNLEFEITESAAMEDIDKTIETLSLFKGLGLHLSIDDFGTGYSSLNYLKRFPIHTLKIDQSFVRNLGATLEDAAIVKSIITLAHSLKLSVVAEGVETQEQFDYLSAHDCDEIQGYLFSPPVPAHEFTNLLNLRKESSAF